MKKLFLLLCLPFLSLAQSTTITAGTSANVNFPNLTYTQIMAIPTPQKGMQAFDTDYGCMRIYNGNAWRCHDTPQNQPNVLTTAIKADNSNTILETFNDTFFNGSNLVVGNFMGSVTFGGTTLTSAGGQDIFMVKYDANGAVLWTLRIGGAGTGGSFFAGDEAVTDVFCEVGTQSFYITGRLGSQNITGALTTTTTNGTDGFIAKFDVNGNLLWSRQISGTSAAGFDGVAAMASVGSDVYICGYQSGSAALSVFTMGANASNFFAKLDNAGNVFWVNELSIDLKDISCNATKVAITGTYSGSVTLNGNLYVSNGGTDVIVACYNNAGVFQWADSFGSSNPDVGVSILIKNEKVVLAGTHNRGFTWGNESISNLGISSSDIFLLQYNLLGGKDWIKGFYGIGSDLVKKITTDIMGNIYMIGTTNNLIWLRNEVLNSMATPNIFVAKLTPDGYCLWARMFNTASLNCSGLATTIVNGYSKVMISGNFQGTNARFGHTLITSANINMFLATLTEN